jgi:hypothetical protein
MEIEKNEHQNGKITFESHIFVKTHLFKIYK